MAPARHVLVLASASPRRRELLESWGIVPCIAPSHVEERSRPGEDPRSLVLRLAEAKARAVAAAMIPSGAPSVVLAADTEVVLDGMALGKPHDPAAAAAMLGRLRGREHDVLTGVFLLRTDDGRAACGIDATRVRLRDFDDAELQAYVDTGEPMDKAGAYAIQGHGARLVAAIDGSWSNVVGLPIERLSGWLADIGLGRDALGGSG
jgi:septum formation protein